MVEFVFNMAETLVKKEKLLATRFSPFPSMFSKGFFPRFVKSWDCVVKGERLHKCELSAKISTMNKKLSKGFKNKLLTFPCKTTSEIVQCKNKCINKILVVRELF